MSHLCKLPVNSVLGIFGLTSSSSVSFSNFRFFGTLGNVESALKLYVFTSLEIRTINTQ